MKKILKTRKAVALALSLLLLIQTVIIATTVISASAEATVPAATAGETVAADIASGLAGMAEDGWTHYYHENYYYHYQSPMTAQSADTSMWYVTTRLNESVLSRNDSYKTHNYRKPWSNISQIVYEGKTFENFEVKARIYYSQHTLGNDTPLYIGFGQSNTGHSLLNKYDSYSGGKGIAIGEGGNVALINPYGGTHGDTDNDLDYTTTQSIADNTFYDLKLVVLNGKATVYVNGALVTTYNITGTTKGFVSFGGARANASGFARFEVTEYKEPDVSADFTSLPDFAAQGFTYYHADATSQALTGTTPTAETSLSFGWYYNSADDSIVKNNHTVAKSTWYEPWYTVSQVVYNKNAYKDFELDVSYYYSQHSRPSEKSPLYIGFGKTNLTSSLFDTTGAGGMAIAIKNDGNVALVSNGAVGTYTTEAAIAVDTWTDIKLAVAGTMAKVYRNNTLIATYTLPDNYNGGYVSFGAARANSSRFRRFDIYGTPADPNLYTAVFNTDLQDSTLWAPYWAKDVTVNATLNSMSFARGFYADQETDGTKYVKRTKQGADHTGTALTSAEFETYSATFNVAQLTYIAKKYKNFELNATYQFSTHSNNNSRVLIAFGRKDAAKYATHADGGAVLEFDSNANVVYRDANGTVAATTAAPASAAKTTTVSVKVVVDAWIAKVTVNDTELGSFIVPENYEGYVSIGATQANDSRFYSLSIKATEDNAEGETRPTPVDPDTLPYEADFGDGLPEGWKSYWMRDMLESSELLEKPFGVSWYHVTGENGHLRRTDSGGFFDNAADKQTVSSTFNIAQLAYANRKFKNFEMEFEYRYVGSTGARILLGLGRRDLTKFANHEDGGAVISLASDGNLSVTVAGGTPYSLTTNAPESAALENMVKVKVKVDKWLFTVWVNDVEMGTYLLPEDYEGYVSVGATKALPSELHSLKISPLDDNEEGETRPDESLYSPDMQEYSTEFKNGMPDGWANYWLEDSTAEGDAGSQFVGGTIYGYHWTNSGGDEGYMSRTDSGYMSRVGINVNMDIENSTYNIAQLTYADRKFNNFVMKLTYVFNSNGDGRVMLGFGRKDINRYATHKDGGIVLSFNSAANVSAYIAGAEETELSNTAPGSAARFNEVNVTLTVDEWIATVNINGVDVAAYLLPEDYKGYISVGATRAKTSYFKSITVTPLADNEATDVRPTEAPSFDVDWSEIIGKEPDNGVPPSVSGLPFLDTSLGGESEEYIIRLYEDGIPAKFYLEDKMLCLPWEGITIGELLGSMWIAENASVKFTLPDGTEIEDMNTVLITGVLMQVYENDALSETFKIVVGDYTSDGNASADSVIKQPSADNGKLPDTGDSSTLLTTMIILMLSMLGVALTVMLRKGKIFAKRG